MSLYETLRDALRAEEPVALATIVEVAEEGTDGGAGPELGLGAKLLVRPDSPVLGSLGDEALDVLGGDGRARLCTFGYSDDEAFAVGLTCGGTIHLLVEPLDW